MIRISGFISGDAGKLTSTHSRLWLGNLKLAANRAGRAFLDFAMSRKRCGFAIG
jgi:hypothetical protein